MGCTKSKAEDGQSLVASAAKPAEGMTCADIAPLLTPAPPLQPPDEDQLAFSASLMRKALFVTDKPGNIGDFYSLEEQLGEGNFGSVKRAQSKSSKATVAVKTITKAQKTNFERGIKKIRTEIRVLEKMNHPNIVKLSEVYEDRHVVYLVMELCTGKSLKELLALEPTRTLPEPQAAILMRQVLAAVAYMHAVRVAHRDLKPENLLFNTQAALEESLLKVTDFGLSCEFAADEVLKEKVGTLVYTSPQVLQGSYNHLCDLWSCGIILYEMLFGAAPFIAESEEQLGNAIAMGRVRLDAQASWRKASAAAKGLIALLLAVDPGQRCSAEAGLRHEWVARGGIVVKATDAAATGNARSWWRQLLNPQLVCDCTAHVENSDTFGDGESDAAGLSPRRNAGAVRP